MSNSNNDNPKIGRAFQETVRNWFSKKRNEIFFVGISDTYRQACTAP